MPPRSPASYVRTIAMRGYWHRLLRVRAADTEEADMKAMVYRGPYRVRVEEKPRPRIEHPNDAIVRVRLAAICGSDLHLFHGMMPDTRVGHTFGHEFIGEVDEVGSSVQNLQVGDRVMVPFNVFCGSCFFCARGLYSNCHNVNPNATAVGGIYGYSHTTGGYDGGQAQFVRVPFADVGPSKIPEWMEEEDAVLLTDALATGYFGAQLGDIHEGDVVVVFGAGPVGLFAAKSAWLMGAGRVIVVDHLDFRLAKARDFAHAETYNFTEHADVVLLLKKLTDYLGADVVIDAVGAEADGNLMQHVTSAKMKLQGGSPVALNWAIDTVRKGGTVSVVGAYGPLFSAVKFGDALNKGLTLRMNQAPVKRQWPRLFEHVRNGYLKPSDIVTHRIPLEHIAEAYHIMSAKLDGCIKPLILPDAS
jgi:threonine dehydrogenase-like Zn-dependent dehydrogenase